jgi:virginiamycin B lyase
MKRAMTLAAMCYSLLLVGAAPAQPALLTTFPLPPSLSWADKIVAGPDGAMWFTQETLDPGSRHQFLLGRITTAGAVSTRALPLGTFARSLAIGPDGALWYATGTDSGARLGRVTADAIGELGLPGLQDAFDAVTGPDGALWFTAIDRGARYRIGRVGAGGEIVTFPLPGVEDVGSIVSGPGPAVWVALDGGVGRVDASGRLRRFRLPLLDDLSASADLAAAPDGALWIADGGCSCIMRMTTAGRVRVIPLPGQLPGAIAVGSDGALWYSDLDGIGRVTTTGETTMFPLPELPGDLATGPDGAMWFSMVHLDLRGPADPSHGSSAIGRIDVPANKREFLVVRLTGAGLHGRAGRMLRVRFTTTRRAAGTLQLLRGETVAGSAPVAAGATTASVRLPRRPGSYRALLRLKLPSQTASDAAGVRVTRRTGQ